VNETVSVVGVARNCEDTLEESLRAIERAVLPLQVRQWMIVESDSTDGTVAKMLHLSQVWPEFDFISLGNLSTTIPGRLERLAFCRETYRKSIIESETPSDWIVVADLDGVTKKLTRGEIYNQIESNDVFDVMSASCYGPYYDILALRLQGVIERDYRDDEEEILMKSGNPFRAKYMGLISRQKRLKVSQPPIEVNSAFGGLTIYRADCLKQASYTDELKASECEHVSFHSGLRRAGRRIAIMPSLRVHPEMRHHLFARLIFRPLWLFLSTLPPALAQKLASTVHLKVGR
jgi:hypothetical protein